MSNNNLDLLLLNNLENAKVFWAIVCEQIDIDVTYIGDFWKKVKEEYLNTNVSNSRYFKLDSYVTDILKEVNANPFTPKTIPVKKSNKKVVPVKQKKVNKVGVQETIESIINNKLEWNNTKGKQKETKQREIRIKDLVKELGLEASNSVYTRVVSYLKKVKKVKVNTIKGRSYYVVPVSKGIVVKKSSKK